MVNNINLLRLNKRVLGSRVNKIYLYSLIPYNQYKYILKTI